MPTKKQRKAYRKHPKHAFKYGKGTESWLSIEETAPLLKARGIRTVQQYYKWHRENRIQWCPRMPFRVFRDSWTGWGDYLGTYNGPYAIGSDINKIRNKNFWSYEEARRYLHPIGLKTMKDFRDWTRSDDYNENIPRNPEHYYRSRGTWLGWPDFTGKDLKAKLDAVQKESKDRIWLFMQHPKEPQHAFWYIVVSRPELPQVKKKGFVIKKQFIYEEGLKNEVENILDTYAERHEDEKKGHYVSNTVANIDWELTTLLLMDTKK